MIWAVVWFAIAIYFGAFDREPGARFRRTIQAPAAPSPAPQASLILQVAEQDSITPASTITAKPIFENTYPAADTISLALIIVLACLVCLLAKLLWDFAGDQWSLEIDEISVSPIDLVDTVSNYTTASSHILDMGSLQVPPPYKDNSSQTTDQAPAATGLDPKIINEYEALTMDLALAEKKLEDLRAYNDRREVAYTELANKWKKIVKEHKDLSDNRNELIEDYNKTVKERDDLRAAAAGRYLNNSTGECAVVNAVVTMDQTERQTEMDKAWEMAVGGSGGDPEWKEEADGDRIAADNRIFVKKNRRRGAKKS